VLHRKIKSFGEPRKCGLHFERLKKVYTSNRSQGFSFFGELARLIEIICMLASNLWLTLTKFGFHITNMCGSIIMNVYNTVSGF
jgi:hypothetical protein